MRSHVRSLKHILSLLCLIFAVSALGALDVDVEELETSVTDTISFINYSGPYDDIDTIDEIRGIGVFLSSEISSGTSRLYAGKYRITHILPEEGSTLRGADLLELLPDARVDHIDNLRRIISAYLESRYGYSPEDARILGRLVTIYNAVHRGNLELFSSRYVPALSRLLTAETAGLALSYDQWPGKSQIVIPLAPDAAAGQLSSVPADELADEAVEETLRDSPDMGIEERMETADLIDRTVDEQRSEEEALEEELEQEETALNQALQESEDREETLMERLEELPEDSPEREEVEEELAREQQQQQEITERQDEVDEQQDDLQQQQESTEAADQRSREIREQVADDVESASTQPETRQSPVQLARGRISGDRLLSTLVIADANSGTVLHSAPEEILGRSYLETRQGIVAIGADENGPVLLLLSAEDLSLLRTGDAEISPYSPLVAGGSDDIYAIVREAGEWYAGRFDANLNLLFRSSIPVAEASDLVLHSGKLMVQRKDGRFTGLDTAELSVNP